MQVSQKSCSLSQVLQALLFFLEMLVSIQSSLLGLPLESLPKWLHVPKDTETIYISVELTSGPVCLLLFYHNFLVTMS